MLSHLCSWDFPGKNSGVGCCFLLQGIFLNPGIKLSAPHCRQTLYCLNHQGSPKSSVSVLSPYRIFFIDNTNTGYTTPQHLQWLPNHTQCNTPSPEPDLICKASVLQHSIIISGLSPHHSTPAFNHLPVPQTKPSSSTPHDLETC